MWKIGVRDWVITVNLVNSTNYLEQVFSSRIFIFQFLSSLWLLDTFCFSLERVWQQICQQFLYFSCLTTGILVLHLNVNLTSCTLIYILLTPSSGWFLLSWNILSWGGMSWKGLYGIASVAHANMLRNICNACMMNFGHVIDDWLIDWLIYWKINLRVSDWWIDY